jgi:hypothetical protein
MRRKLALFALAALCPGLACGGTSDPDGLLSGGDIGGGSSSSGSSSSGSGGIDAAPEVSGSSSGGGYDASLPTDASTDRHEAGGGPMDSGHVIDVLTSGTLLCPPSGSKVCTASDICCATGSPGSGNQRYACQSPARTCQDTTGTGTVISCASGADCPNQVCCGENLAGSYTQVSCQPDCTGTGPQGGDLITFCNPALNVGCDAGMTCQPSQVLVGFYVCQ